MEIGTEKIDRFLEWWRAPSTKKDRYAAATIGAFGGFWLGGLGRVMLGALPVSMTEVGMWALVGVVVFSLLGLVFPKLVSCICYPLSILGVGN